MSDTTLTPPVPSTPFSPDEMTLFGTPIDASGFAVSTGTDESTTLELTARDGDGELTLAAVFGYAFEGACYRFARPRVMAFRPRDAADADGCGFGTGFTMWRLDRHDGVVGLAVTGGELQDALIEAHADDDRSPATYASKFVTAHRGHHG